MLFVGSSAVLSTVLRPDLGGTERHKKNKNMAKNKKSGNVRNGQKAQRAEKAKVQQGAENSHSNEGANNTPMLDEREVQLVKRAYELAPEWKISQIAKKKFLALPSFFQNGAGKEACVKEALAGHKDLIQDPTRYWIWLVDETKKLIRVWDFEETCAEAEVDPLTVAQHLILEGKMVCNAVRLEGLAAYGSKIRMFVEPLFHDEFKLFGDKLNAARPKQPEVAHE